jgi:SAM-dependent methyltransferase
MEAGMQPLAAIAARYDTDKSASPGYLADFEEVLGDRRTRPAAVLELGVFHGGSLQMWRDDFAEGPVVGLDLSPVQVSDPSGRVRIYAGSQGDRDLLDRIRAECAPDGFDLIVDDCAHIGRLARASFWHLYPRHLRPGGIYVIEDWAPVTGIRGRIGATFTRDPAGPDCHGVEPDASVPGWAVDRT